MIFKHRDFHFISNHLVFFLLLLKILRCHLVYLCYLCGITNTVVYANLGEGFGVTLVGCGTLVLFLHFDQSYFMNDFNLIFIIAGDHTFNGEETDGNRTFSEGEGDTSKATDTEMASPRKEKKKKSGLRTPSFLKKKKKDKKKDK